MEENELVLLTNLEKGESHLVRIGKGAEKVRGLGVIDFDKLAQLDLGQVYQIGSTKFFLSKPTLSQGISSLERKAQVINQKDIPLILYHGNISNARSVVEGGAGSGFLSCALASTIRPPGKVVTYEIREDFAKVARRNLDTLGLQDVCTIKIADITKGIEERDVDAVVVDIPNPQDCVAHAYESLRPGGVFISYVPNMNQIETCVQVMKEAGFSNISTLETLLRNIVVTDGGTRPDFSMLGHTGYITIGHKIG
jgi:tRNA (adenine57-N1/adenine58-N1)-methyltransferase